MLSVAKHLWNSMATCRQCVLALTLTLKSKVGPTGVVVLVMFLLGYFATAEISDSQRKLEQREANVGDCALRVTLLQVMGTNTFGRISSHFSNTALSEKIGFMYAGTGTAGIPVAENRRIIFYLTGEKVPSTMNFHPTQATLRTGTNIVAAITNETIHMSCPGWVFPNWQQERGRVWGFLVFPHGSNLKAELTIPFIEDGKPRSVTFNFGQ